MTLPILPYYCTGHLAAAAQCDPATVRYHVRVMQRRRLLDLKRRGPEDGHVRLDRTQALRVLEFMEGRKRKTRGRKS